MERRERIVVRSITKGEGDGGGAAFMVGLSGALIRR